MGGLLDMDYASPVEREALGKGQMESNVRKVAQSWINAKLKSLGLPQAMKNPWMIFKEGHDLQKRSFQMTDGMMGWQEGESNGKRSSFRIGAVCQSEHCLNERQLAKNEAGKSEMLEVF